MKRVTAVKRAGEWDAQTASDVVVLDAQDRHRRRIVFVGEEGACYLLDLSRPAQLRNGDGLLLESGTCIRVAAKSEALVEVAVANAAALARLAWHLGNRHTEVQFIGERLRIRRDHVLEEMLRGLDAELTVIESAFDPEPGVHAHHGRDDDA